MNKVNNMCDMFAESSQYPVERKLDFELEVISHTLIFTLKKKKKFIQFIAIAMNISISIVGITFINDLLVVNNYH